MLQEQQFPGDSYQVEPMLSSIIRYSAEPLTPMPSMPLGRTFRDYPSYVAM